MFYSHLLIHAEIYIYIYIYILDTYQRNKLIRRKDERRRKTSLTIFLPLTLFVRFRKGCSRVVCERELETKHKL